MAQDLVNLDAFKVQRDPSTVELPADDSLAGGIGTAYAIIGYKGRTWSLRYRGETHLFKDKAGQLTPTIDVVILHAAPGKSKSYFPNWKDGSSDPPLCASIDGITPDPDVEQMQAEACGICPRNELKVQKNGRRGKECTDYKRLAVALMPNITARMFGEPMLEPVFLRVPPASLNALALLDQKMGAKGLGYHYSAYLTRISFVQVDGKGQPLSYPQMQFFAVRPLTKEELLPVLDLRKDPQCQRITGEAGTHGGARAIAGPTNSNVNLAAFAKPANDNIKQIEAKANQPSPGIGQSTAPAVTKAVEPEEETGFGSTTADATTTSPSKVPAAGTETVTNDSEVYPAPATTTVADTGEPEESDAELDARIAGIINKAK